MIQLAQESDIPLLVQGMLQLKQSTGWSQYYQPGYNATTLSQFITDRLYDSRSVLYVSYDTSNVLRAFCGASLNQFYLPPYMPLLFEWGWFGQPRAATQCWQYAVRWGKKRGAQLVGRVRARNSQQPRKIVEEYVWKVIV